MGDFEPNISDEAVIAATGNDWATWFHILDSVGARTFSHKAIVTYLAETQKVGPWWQQMVTVTYEQARGLREKHEKPSGFQVSRSRTLPLPPEAVYNAWKDEQQRLRWLPDPGFTIRAERPNKSLRITWIDGFSTLDVNFYKKGADKCQVTVQHSKLEDAAQAEAMKAFWGKALEKLGYFLAG
jgi:uncharacterized protein YndB with AHSA1/START domain